MREYLKPCKDCGEQTHINSLNKHNGRCIFCVLSRDEAVRKAQTTPKG